MIGDTELSCKVNNEELLEEFDPLVAKSAANTENIMKVEGRFTKEAIADIDEKTSS